MNADPDREVDPNGSLRRVLLVGFMGSGKSSVGKALAEVLGWRFVDFDDAVAEEEGCSVPEIFRTLGEAHFREVEGRVGRRLLEEDRVVLASGGGWAATPGRLDEVPPGTETFWLRVSTDEALRRVSSEPGRRPMLDARDAEREAARLLAKREPRYARAASVVDTNGRSVEDVTAGVLAVLRQKYPAVPRTEAE
ncbi:MAG: shikimate kinase [Gemmatimonadota bacterium]